MIFLRAHSLRFSLWLAFVGLASLAPDGARNTAYYGKAVSPVDTLIRHSASNPRAGELINNVTEHTPKK